MYLYCIKFYFDIIDIFEIIYYLIFSFLFLILNLYLIEFNVLSGSIIKYISLILR